MGKIGGLLFFAVFAVAGIGIFAFQAVPMMANTVAAKSWQRTPAQLLSYDLQTNRGDDADTYKVTAKYRYSVNGREYTASRVGWSKGSDNVGSFHQDMHQRLAQVAASGDTFPVWVDPNDPSNAVIDRDMRWGMLLFTSIFLLIFGGIGVGGIISMIKHWRSDEADGTGDPQRPWTDVPEWRDAEQYSDSKSGNKILFWFAVFWNLISLAAVFAAIDALREQNYQSLLVLIFPAAGLALFGYWWKLHRGFKRTGLMPLIMDPYPGSIGGQCGGSIRVTNKLEAVPRRSEVTLQCVRSYRSGDESRQRVEWQRRMTPSWRHGTRGLEAQFCFDLEEDLPHSDPPLTSEGIEWRVLFSMTLADETKIDRQYSDLPVFATQQRAESLNRDAHYLNSPSVQAAHEKLLDTILPLRTDATGYYLDYPAYQNWTGLVIGIIGIVLFVVGIFIPSWIAMIVLVLLGAIFALVGITWFGGGLKVRIGPEGITSQKTLFGINSTEKMVPSYSFKKLKKVKSHSSTTNNKTTQYYTLMAHGEQGEEVPVAIDLREFEEVRAAKQRILQLLGKEPSADIEEPSADIEEPSADIEEPSADTEESPAESKEPSAQSEQP